MDRSIGGAPNGGTTSPPPGIGEMPTGGGSVPAGPGAPPGCEAINLDVFDEPRTRGAIMRGGGSVSMPDSACVG